MTDPGSCAHLLSELIDRIEEAGTRLSESDGAARILFLLEHLTNLMGAGFEDISLLRTLINKVATLAKPQGLSFAVQKACVNLALYFFEWAKTHNRLPDTAPLWPAVLRMLCYLVPLWVAEPDHGTRSSTLR